MSSTTSFSPRDRTFLGSAHGPAGLGALKVPASSQRSCHAISMSWAMRAV